MRHLQLSVDGMSCRRCVREVSALLRDVPGVETVVADPRTSSVRVSGSMSVQDVLGAFAGTRYAADLARRSPRARHR